jgi:hypothetical protein
MEWICIPNQSILPAQFNYSNDWVINQSKLRREPNPVGIAQHVDVIRLLLLLGSEFADEVKRCVGLFK